MSARDPQELLALLQAQKELASCELDLDGLMELSARRARELTGASTGSIELEAGGGHVDEVGDGGGAGVWSMISVPLVHRGETLGQLTVGAPEAGRFEEADTAKLEELSGVIAARIVQASELAARTRESRVDSLTGLANRRAYDERLTVEAGRCRRTGAPMALCLFDLNEFKGVNDLHGHPAGDEVLQQVAKILGGSRVSDDAFRIGGDEFAVLMPNTTWQQGQRAAERLARAVDDAELTGGTVSVAYGVAETMGDPVAVHMEADRRLLAAKGERTPEPSPTAVL